jgi:hypothetical protein
MGHWESGEHGGLRQLQVSRFLAEVAIRGCAHAIVVGSVVDGVQIELQDLIFE